MKTKHTPGPFELVQKHSRPIDQYWTPVVQSASGTRIAEFKFEHDAQLFTAAPEMLEALERVVAKLGPLNLDGEIFKDELKDLIAKARGES